MRVPVRLWLLLAVVSGAAAAGCGSQQLNDWETQLGFKKPTPTPSITGTSTPTPSGTTTSQNTVVTPVNSTTANGVTTFDFGTVSLAAGTSPHFQVTAPTDVIGLEFIAQGAAADAAKDFIFFSITAPGGRVVDDNTAENPVRQSPNDGTTSFALPADDTANSAVAAGTWQFHVAAFDGGTGTFQASNPHVYVKARTNTGGAVPDGYVSLNLFFVQGNGTYNATTAQVAGSEIQQALADVDTLYNSVGLHLDISNATYTDLPNSSSYAVLSSMSQMEQLFEMSSSATNPRVNLFFVSDFQGSLNGAAGIAGGIPATMALNGTQHSGVAIQPQGPTNVSLTAEVMAHEMGHSLGLYHTTEFSPAQYGADGYDPISDTPQCPNLTISAGTWSACPDYQDGNVMFPGVTGNFTGFTTGQGIVLRSAVGVHNTSGVGFAPQNGAFVATLPRGGIFGPMRHPIACRWVPTHARPQTAPVELP